jgi:hypothetical protein
MDPAMWELLRDEEGAEADRPIEAIIRFVRPGIEIPGVRIVARFGSIVTCRIPGRRHSRPPGRGQPEGSASSGPVAR